MKDEWSLPVRFFVGGFLFAMFVWVAWLIRSAIEPLGLAAFIAYLSSPMVSFLQTRTRLSRSASVNVVFFSALFLLLAIPAVLGPIFYDDLHTFTTDVLTRVSQLRLMLSQPILVAGFTLQMDRLVPSLQFSSQALSPLNGQALAILRSTSRGALWSLVVLIATYYFMADWPGLRTWLIGLGPEAYHEDARRLYAEIRGVWLSYLRGQLTLMFVVGVIFSLVWMALGVPGSILLGVLAGLLTLIPDVGPFIAAVTATIVSLLEGSSWITLSPIWFAALVLGMYILVVNMINIWLRPRILGRSVRLHEGLVFIAIIVAVTVQGVLLAVTIVPLLATAGVVGRYVRARLLGLSPFPVEESDEAFPTEQEPV